MDGKMAIHLEMQMAWMLYKCDQGVAREAMKSVDAYESAHGFGIEDWADSDEWKEAFEEFTKTDAEHKRLWHEWNVRFDTQMEDLRKFCELMERFTDGQIDRETARTMATNPRYADRLEAIILGKAA